MTPDQINQAYGLLQTLATLQAQLAQFQNATSFQIQALGPTGNIGTAIFPAAGYSSAVLAAFTTEIDGIVSQLVALGVTGL